MFLQFVILRFCNQAGRGLLPDETQENVYFFIQILAVFGFVLHGVLHKLLSAHARHAASYAALCVCAVSALILTFTPCDTVLYLVTAGLSVPCIAYAGGAAYIRMTRCGTSGVRVGVCMGAGYSAALLLQYFTQLRFLITPLLAPLTVAASAALGFLFFRLPDEITAGTEDNTEKTRPHKLVFAAVIALFMLLFTSYYSGYIHHLQIASGYTEYNVYTWPRLLMIPAVVGFGFAGDIKKGRYLPLATLCVAVVSLLNAALTEVTGAYWFNMCLYYVSLSAAVSYYNLTFWRLAPGTRTPGLWSVAGRVLDSMAVLPSLFVSVASLSPVVILSLNIAALAVVIILTALNGDFNLADQPAKKTEPAAPVTAEDALLCIKERYGLTPSEFKVLRELVLTEDKQVAVAERLSVKIRTVQANVTSIYRKTGVSTRSGLVQLYRDASANK